MRRPWAWLALGLALGFTVGLVYTWVLQPVAFYDTYPPLMREDFRADWIRMTGLAYVSDGDLSRAQLRLKDLPQEEIRNALIQALDAAVTLGDPLPALQNLAALAQGYGAESAAVRIYASEEILLSTSTPTQRPTAATLTPIPPSTATSVPPSPTAKPTPTPTPQIALPTPTPMPPPYTITQTMTSCLPTPSIAISLTESVTVTVRGRGRQQLIGLPGREVWLLWTGGADRAFTGLRPEKGLGYADFNVEPEGIYNLYVDAPSGAPVTTLKVDSCTTEDGESGGRSWLIIMVATGDR